MCTLGLLVLNHYLTPDISTGLIVCANEVYISDDTCGFAYVTMYSVHCTLIQCTMYTVCLLYILPQYIHRYRRFCYK